MCAVLLAAEVASYVAAAAFGWLFAEGRILAKSEVRLTAAYSLYTGIVLALLLFVSYANWVWSKRASRLVRLGAAAILVTSIAIPVGAAVGSRGQEGSLSGRIYGPDGTAAANEVTVYCAPLDPSIHITRGDPAPPALTVKGYGEYSIGGLPAGRYAIVALCASPLLFTEKVTIANVEKGLTNPQDLVLVPGGSIAGRVNGIEPAMTRSAPFAVRYTVQLEGLGFDFAVGQAIVAEDGTYLVKDVAPGRVHISVNNGFMSGSYQAQSVWVTVRSGQQTQQDFSIIK